MLLEGKSLLIQNPDLSFHADTPDIGWGLSWETKRFPGRGNWSKRSFT